MENLILNRISELKKNVDKNQLLLFIHYFLLIDIDPEYYQKYLDELIDITSDRKVNYSIMVKLLMIITTKCHQKGSLEKIIKSKIEVVYKKVYPDKKRNAKGQINRLVKELGSEDD